MKGISGTAQSSKSGKERLLRHSLYVPNFVSRIWEFYTFKPWISSFLCLAEATSPSEPPPRHLVWSEQGLHPLNQIHLFSSFFWPSSWLSWICVIENTPLMHYEKQVARRAWPEMKRPGPKLLFVMWSWQVLQWCHYDLHFFLLKRGSIIPALNF